LRQISDQLGDLIAMYRMVNRERIVRGKAEALGDGTKKKLWESCDGSRSQADLAKAVKVTPQRVSQIIADLADAGLVARNPDGKWTRRLES
jgi:hypothetical protein